MLVPWITSLSSSVKGFLRDMDSHPMLMVFSFSNLIILLFVRMIEQIYYVCVVKRTNYLVRMTQVR